MSSVVAQKFIAQSGLCSRRRAEELIKLGLVKVNGQKISLGARVEDDDKVEVEGRILKPVENKIYIKLNKPVGYTCTVRDFENEKKIFDLVKVDERLFVCGRLDKDSRGLVLLTNDGELTQKLTHPSFEHRKKYLVKVAEKNFSQIEIKRIIASCQNGIDIGERTLARAKSIVFLAPNSFEITLTEGKKRQIRRMLTICGLEVLDLIRLEIAGLELGDLPEGKWQYLSTEELEQLKKTAG